MHTSESLDPVVYRLSANLPYIDCWLADMSDALNLLETLQDYLHNPDRETSGTRLLALLRVALRDLAGGVDELTCILNLSEKARTPVTPSDTSLTPVTPSDTSLTPVTPSDTSLTVVTPSDTSLTPVTPSDLVNSRYSPVHFCEFTYSPSGEFTCSPSGFTFVNSPVHPPIHLLDSPRSEHLEPLTLDQFVASLFPVN